MGTDRIREKFKEVYAHLSPEERAREWERLLNSGTLYETLRPLLSPPRKRPPKRKKLPTFSVTKPHYDDYFDRHGRGPLIFRVTNRRYYLQVKDPGLFRFLEDAEALAHPYGLIADDPNQQSLFSSARHNAGKVRKALKLSLRSEDD
jgi:hypothetical protein